jgi:hypothetical protein
MKRTSKIINSALVAIILIGLTITDSEAIPAFARKYSISCQVCHSPAVPRLKAFGEDFAGQGFRMTEYEAPRFFVEAGDDKLSLIRDFPLGLRLDAHATYNSSNQGSADLSMPYGVKLLSGGELSENLSYYLYFYMSERGEIAGVEDAFLMWHDLFGSGVNLYVGQFQKSDPLFKREARLTLEDYYAYTVAPGNSRGSLKYDRGIMLEYGLPTGTDIVAQITNGNGIGAAGNGHLFDMDKYKTWLLKVNQGIGEVLSVGFFGSSGKEILPGETVDFVNSMTYFGPDMSLNFNEKLIVNLQYLQRKDSEVWLEEDMASRYSVKTHGGFGEIIYAPRGDLSNWYFTGLVNIVDSDIDELDYSSLTMHIGHLFRRNVRLVAEYTYQLSGTPYGKASLGFVSAF